MIMTTITCTAFTAVTGVAGKGMDGHDNSLLGIAVVIAAIER